MPRKASLSIELLETFLLLIENEGDAAVTARQLDLNQPSMSKRMSMLRRGGRVLYSWLERQGKTWFLTEEGKRVLPSVREIVRRYRNLLEFTKTSDASLADVNFACGQRAVTGFVLEATKAFQAKCPEVRLRVSTMRGRARILGVATGQLDLATVTTDDEEIRKLARRPVHIEKLYDDPLVVVCAKKAPWASRLAETLEDGSVTSADLLALANGGTPRGRGKKSAKGEEAVSIPFVLPEEDAGIRKQLDFHFKKRKSGTTIAPLLEMGGWPALLEYVRSGVGVGISIESACQGEKDLVKYRLSAREFPPTEMKLISCLDEDEKSPSLSEHADLFRSYLIEEAKKYEV